MKGIRKTAGGILVVMLLGLLAPETRGGDPAAANRRAVEMELAALASAAQRHFLTPASRGGGGGAFDNSYGGTSLSTITQLTRRPTTGAGTYTLGTVCATSITLCGTGTAIGTDGNCVSVTCTVFSDSVYFSYNN